MNPLPSELLLRVMQHVPLPQRLAGPALVCQAWAAAAVAATTTISISYEKKVPSGLKVWLQKHGTAVEQLDVSLSHQGEYGVEIHHRYLDDALHLPCGKLQQLTSLSQKGIDLHLTPDLETQSLRAASSNSMVAVLPNLVELHLEECSVSSKADLLQLVGTSGLTSLHLENVSWASGSQEGKDKVLLPLAIVPALEQCSNLLTLHVHFCWGRDTDLPSSYSSISRLQHLKDLALVLPSYAPSHFLPSVPAGPTHLGLTAFHSRHDYNDKPVVLQQIPQLQHLQSLQIESVSGFDAAGLVNMTQLLCLQLKGVDLDAAALGRMPHLQQLMLEDCSTEASPASALAAVGQLSQLRVLKVLNWVGLPDYTSLLHEAPVSGLSALTASSQLQRLHVNCLARHSSYGSALPDGAVAHMLPKGRLLLQLVSLQLGPEHAYSIFDADGNAGCISGQDLQCIACGCPGLQSLHIKGMLKAREGTDALLQLRECRSLSVGGAANALDNSAAAVVTQMTQLTHLTWCCSRGFTSMGLQLMTRLTNLQRLVISPVSDDCHERHEMEADLVAMLDL